MVLIGLLLQKYENMTDLTKEESDKLIAALNKLKIKPKADTPEELELWLKTYGAEAAVKKEPVDVETTKTASYFNILW